jgi:hypothetical protein
VSCTTGTPMSRDRFRECPFRRKAFLIDFIINFWTNYTFSFGQMSI